MAKIIGPEIGDMACGEFGEGKMTEPEQILRNINDYFSNCRASRPCKTLVHRKRKVTKMAFPLLNFI